jgi:Asp-tRNA(Asn)/Glu-tRNA(Gln) amidotransferase C subunit
MNSKGNGSRKTKTELMNELSVVRQELSSTQRELTECREALSETEQNLELARVELSEAQRELEEKANEISRLTQQLAELQKADKRHSQQVATLRSELRAAKEEVQKKAEEVKREKRDAERNLLQLEGRIQELEASLQKSPREDEEAEQPLDEAVPGPKATFRIDLYARPDGYHGKITHLLTGEKRAFRGFDRNLILDFIAQHLGELEEEVDEQPALPSSAERAAASTAEEGAVVGSPILRELKTVPSQSGVPTNLLRSDQPFEIRLSIDLSDLKLSPETGMHYEAAVYSKALGGGPTRVLGQSQGPVSPAETAKPLTIRVESEPLPPGLYRLQSAVTLVPGTGQPALRAASPKAELLHVY